jgi:hypothetical protein
MPTQDDSTAPISLATVTDLIAGHYREELALAVKAGLAVIASLSLKGRDHCLVLVFEGGSGRGKSIIVRVLMPDRAGTDSFLERADDFTPASFVSHASNRTADELSQIDLLPRIKGKVMLTKELAPLFRDDEKVLRQNFARLTSVLDGDGYKTNSGTHGSRGYTGRYIFNWIGATTPIPERTHKVMSQLGNRILFYEVAGDECTEEELIEFAENYNGADVVVGCRKLVNEFIQGHFQRHPLESVDANSITIPSDLLRELVHYVKLISHGRVEIYRNESGYFESASPEGPHRVLLLLQTVVRGLALLEGRSTATSDDLEVVRHIAFSSLPRFRRELLRVVIAAGGHLHSTCVANTLDVSKPTALDRMRELAATGVCKFVDGNSSTSNPAQITLRSNWRWLLETPTPLSDSGVSEAAAVVEVEVASSPST